MATLHEWLAKWSYWLWPLLINHLLQAMVLSAFVFAVLWMIGNGVGWARVRYMVYLLVSGRFALALAMIALLGFGVDVETFFHAYPQSVLNVRTVIEIVPFAIAAAPSSGMIREVTVAHNELWCLLS